MANRSTSANLGRRRGEQQHSQRPRPPPVSNIPPQLDSPPLRQQSFGEAQQVAHMQQRVHEQEQQIMLELAQLLQMEQAAGISHDVPLMSQMPPLSYPTNVDPQAAPLMFMGFPQQMPAAWLPSQPQQPTMAFYPQMMPFPQQPYAPSYQSQVQYAPQHFDDPPIYGHQPVYGSQPPPQGAPLPNHPPLPPEPPPTGGSGMAPGFLPVDQQGQLSAQLHEVVLPEVGAEHAQAVTLLLLDNELPCILQLLTSAQDRSEGALPRPPHRPQCPPFEPASSRGAAIAGALALLGIDIELPSSGNDGGDGGGGGADPSPDASVPAPATRGCDDVRAATVVDDDGYGCAAERAAREASAIQKPADPEDTTCLG